MATDAVFDVFAAASPAGWTALDPATGARAAGAGAHEALAALAPKRGARALVCSDAVFSQRVRLPEAQTAGLAPEELEAALFYEVEPFCGFARAEALLAFAPLGGGEWAVSAVRKTDMDAFRAAAAAARCRLAGAVAPPRDAAGADAAAALTLLFPAGGPAAPVVAPPRRAAWDGRALAAAGAAALALVAAVSAADWALLRRERAALLPRLEASERASAENERLRKAALADERRLRDCEEAAARRERAARRLASERDAWLSLFSTLAAAAGDDFAILSIEDGRIGGHAAATVRCVSPSAAAAAGAMARLSAALAPGGWALRPGDVRHPGGGLASFSFQLARPGAEGR